MKLTDILRHLTAALLLPLTLGLGSCDGMIYDDEGDCDPHYKVRFRYDMNMKYADAFSNEVLSVTLYVIDDATGRIVRQIHEDGESLRSEGYLMDVDVAPGRYTLLAWCGEGTSSHFSIPEADVHTGLTCSLGLKRHDQGYDYSDEDLGRLYHGRLNGAEFPDEQGTHIYDVRLTKDTNVIRVVLQHINGEPVEHEKFDFRIDDTNGRLDWDNSRLGITPVTYHPWHLSSGNAGIEDPVVRGSRTQTEYGCALAELTTSRLFKEADKNDEPRLSVTLKDGGGQVLSIPLIRTLLLVKGHHNRKMSDQEYLDRQDEYNLVFFLDDGNRWINTTIYINSWQVVLQDADL
ncbi:FimB/Mfa2 family fimbrial subunit [uncultured Alistipes sp.]|uniref:FimB/Mfa2 family fimbrial subunit n=1 Tax=uncultured Alistipes sp. TaxID=538949 RepID=UPI002639C3D1|nr:FimB/Mfa2 family fimbrial subunit [uncultured Alistipes sp.]